MEEIYGEHCLFAYTIETWNGELDIKLPRLNRDQLVSLLDSTKFGALVAKFVGKLVNSQFKFNSTLQEWQSKVESLEAEINEMKEIIVPRLPNENNVIEKLQVKLREPKKYSTNLSWFVILHFNYISKL